MRWLRSLYVWLDGMRWRKQMASTDRFPPEPIQRARPKQFWGPIIAGSFIALFSIGLIRLAIPPIVEVIELGFSDGQRALLATSLAGVALVGFVAAYAMFSKQTWRYELGGIFYLILALGAFITGILYYNKTSVVFRPSIVEAFFPIIPPAIVAAYFFSRIKK